jgi:hypothetical protein
MGEVSTVYYHTETLVRESENQGGVARMLHTVALIRVPGRDSAKRLARHTKVLRSMKLIVGLL